jgi:hypothetical protein
MYSDYDRNEYITKQSVARTGYYDVSEFNGGISMQRNKICFAIQIGIGILLGFGAFKQAEYNGKLVSGQQPTIINNYNKNEEQFIQSNGGTEETLQIEEDAAFERSLLTKSKREKVIVTEGE